MLHWPESASFQRSFDAVANVKTLALLLLSNEKTGRANWHSNQAPKASAHLFRCKGKKLWTPNTWLVILHHHDGNMLGNQSGVRIRPSILIGEFGRLKKFLIRGWTVWRAACYLLILCEFFFLNRVAIFYYSHPSWASNHSNRRKQRVSQLQVERGAWRLPGRYTARRPHHAEICLQDYDRYSFIKLNFSAKKRTRDDAGRREQRAAAAPHS